MSDDLEIRHKQALERQANADRLTRQRAIEADQRRMDGKIEAQLGDIEAMKLKHELDIENRGHDHQFNRAEDARELERLATETTLRRRDDAIRKGWADDERAQLLEGEILKKIADHRIATRQADQAHGHELESKAADHRINMEAKTTDHLNAVDFATHENELDKDNFEFKERLKLQLHREFGNATEEEVDAAFRRLEASGKI